MRLCLCSRGCSAEGLGDDAAPQQACQAREERASQTTAEVCSVVVFLKQPLSSSVPNHADEAPEEDGTGSRTASDMLAYLPLHEPSRTHPVITGSGNRTTNKKYASRSGRRTVILPEERRQCLAQGAMAHALSTACSRGHYAVHSTWQRAHVSAANARSIKAAHRLRRASQCWARNGGPDSCLDSSSTTRAGRQRCR